MLLLLTGAETLKAIKKRVEEGAELSKEDIAKVPKPVTGELLFGHDEKARIAKIRAVV